MSSRLSRHQTAYSDCSQLYHSIHARGERVEDVVRALEMEEDREGSGAPEADKNSHRKNGMDEAEMEDGELEEVDNPPIPNNAHDSTNLPVSLFPAHSV